MSQSHLLDSAETAASAGARDTSPPPPHRRGPKPGSEAAKRGGRATRDKWGAEHFRRIGAIGGTRVREERGLEFYQEIGRRGGETTRRKLGAEHYARIGRIGGRQRPKYKNPTLLIQDP
jgi:uncharacterized protein